MCVFTYIQVDKNLETQILYKIIWNTMFMFVLCINMNIYFILSRNVFQFNHLYERYWALDVSDLYIASRLHISSLVWLLSEAFSPLSLILYWQRRSVSALWKQQDNRGLHIPRPDFGPRHTGSSTWPYGKLFLFFFYTNCLKCIPFAKSKRCQDVKMQRPSPQT